jgi:glutamate synthase (NADPH/NADH) small chain
MQAEGVEFRCGVDVGKDITGQQLRDDYDAVLVCAGATAPRDLPIPGRQLKGVHFAMEFLPQQNKRNQGDEIPMLESILADALTWSQRYTVAIHGLFPRHLTVILARKID